MESDRPAAGRVVVWFSWGVVCVAIALVLALLAASAARAQSQATGLVAAYAFDEGSGSSVSDSSGAGNSGSIGSAVWSSPGRFGGAVSFNGTNARVTVADAPSLRLTSAMTLEAWVFPTTTSGTWRDVIYKGNDNYYLMATSSVGSRPAAGGIFAGSYGEVFGPSALAANTWTHLAVTYDGSVLRLYVNGALVASQAKTGSLATSSSPLQIGGDSLYGQYFSGRIDEVRVYNTALTQAAIQADMTTPVSGGGGTTPPTVAITAPADNAQVSEIVTVTANATDDFGVSGVQFFVDGVATGAEDGTAPYGLQWDTRNLANGAHTITARARDASGNSTLSAPVNVNVANVSSFQNEILATGFTLPTSIEFLPDGRMLVVELGGRIRVLPSPYTQPDPTPFLQIANIGVNGQQQGIYDVALDPNFGANHFYYVFYTLATPNRDRLSRFTANATNTGTIAGSELVLYQDPEDANAEHHGGAINFGNDGKLYFTTGEHFGAAHAQQLTNPRGKVHRINSSGTIPTDNPFFDGAGPNVDSIWAYGLRNPYRAYYDSPTGRLFIGDVGGNDQATAKEELNLGAAGANYGWPDSEGPCSSPCTSPVYWYPHNGVEAAITGGFVYHGSQFPTEYRGNFFFADYTRNWIKRLTLDASGNVTGVFNFEPADGSSDGPYGDIVYLTEGPDGALYYVDLGYSDVGGTFGVSKIRRIRYLQSNQAPVAVASANPTSGPAPLAVAFSSTGSSDPEGQPLAYAWTFGDGGTSTAANPSHTYATAGTYTARLTISDGENSTLSLPITINVGQKPTATILTPEDGAFFVAGDLISFSGDATDPDDGTLPASAFTWNVDFLHEGHVHPAISHSGIKSGTFTIPTTGHDFSGNTRYRITLTVTDSNGLTDTKNVVIRPTKVNLSFSTAPAGLTLYLDGIARTTPFVHDTLVGFTHTVEARDQTVGSTSFTFSSWSDGGARTHSIVVPSADQSYVATYQSTAGPPPGLVAAYGFDEGSGSSVGDASGSGNAGQVGSATWSSEGKYGQALSFNGTSSRVTVPDSPSLRLTTAMTLEAWVYPTTVNGSWRDVVYKGNDNYYLMATSSHGSRPAAGGIFAGSQREAFGPSVLTANVWTHLAVSYDGVTLRLYVNGGQVASRASTGSLATSANPLQIGGDSIYGQYFSGRIDEVRVYNTARTQAQIQADLNTPIGGGGGDTTPPSAPSSLVASAVGSSQVNLSWSAATDNVGVTGYRVERCQGAGCSSFAEVGTPSGTSFSDTGLAASTSYSFRVRAVDAAGNLGPYSNVATTTTPAGGASGLVAAYGLNEGSGSSVGDSSGIGNNGQIGSATWSTQGKYGNALSFNGSSARVTVPDAPSLRLTTAMTLEAWVFPLTTTVSWRDVIYKGNDNYYLMATSSVGGLPAAGGIFSGSYGEVFGDSVLPANTWTHLAVSWDGSVIELYVNGVLVESHPQAGTLAASSNPLQIGGDGLYGQYFGGRIDEVRVYNTALTQAQIQADMSTPIGG
jgi:glucose/arabinose dehydrogenase/chitodextrinase